ncbi:alpha/beta hydrolase [Microbacterium sp. NPDC057650]|uniref:alpha/beta hydrolase n=1 Tax=unclassified Microbacterium TaxID=2609290 RepID=UPI00366CF876
MFSGLGDLKSFGQSARDLNSDAEDYGAGKAMTIAWYGYDSPDLLGETAMGSAEEGAATLTSSLRGLDLAVSPRVTTTVIGHSYGSTTAFLAVGSAADNLGVDRLVSVGSAGVPDQLYAQNREYAPVSGTMTLDVNMDYSGTQAYGTRAPWDLVARFGQYSSSGHTVNPESLPGAISFESDGGYVPALDGAGEEWAVETPGHASHSGGGNTGLESWQKDNGYLSEGTESFRNVARIVATGEPVN